MGSQFYPDWVSPPGDTIEDRAEELGLTRKELAKRLGISQKHLIDLIKGRVSINPGMATNLERVLDIPADFWLRRDAQYRAALQRKKEIEEATQWKDWLKELPLSWMIKEEWIQKYSNKGAQVLEVLRFLRVGSVDVAQSMLKERVPVFRTSQQYETNRWSLLIWMAKAEQTAMEVQTNEFSPTKLRAILQNLRQLVKERNPDVFLPAMQSLCAEAGVAVVFVPPPKGLAIYGATWWKRNKAIVAMTLRYKTNDHLWFTFFHEIGHILMHGRKNKFFELEQIEPGEREEQANAFARDILIPQKFKKELEELGMKLTSYGPRAELVEDFARMVDTAPGIVVGRLQHDRLIPFSSRLNILKIKYQWVLDKTE